MLKPTIWHTVLFSTLLLTVGAALPLTNSISGTVRDPLGAVISGARIMVHRDSPDRLQEDTDTIVATSDKNGQFTLQVAPGFYDVFVSAPAFSPQCTKVRVREAEPAVYMPRLPPDPLVIKERGDAFSN